MKKTVFEGYSTIIVCGRWDHEGGRPSKYMTSLYNEYYRVRDNVRSRSISIHNGGSIAQLKELLPTLNQFDCVMWFVDISNDEEKLLPSLDIKGTLIQSKNNLDNKYTLGMLLTRMKDSGADALVEFTRDTKRNLIAAKIYLANGYLMGNESTDTDYVARLLYKSVHPDPLYTPIVMSQPVPTQDHAGAFGARRRFDIHSGVDLYGQFGMEVIAMTAGEVVGVGHFTGPTAGSYWWNDTDYVMVETRYGVILYGEILGVRCHVGDWIPTGFQIGRLATVLRNHKGLPMTMLHVELYKLGITSPIKSWPLDKPKPDHLLDPTSLLLSAGESWRQ